MKAAIVVPTSPFGAHVRRRRDRRPGARFGRLEEAARAVLFLASEDLSFVLGEEVLADGGCTRLEASTDAREGFANPSRHERSATCSETRVR